MKASVLAPTGAKRPVVALVGNPNAGKTSVFNALTGTHQKVGNYPGVTTERVSGVASLHGEVVEFVDVPGLYSLNPISVDEKIAVETLLGPPRPDVVVMVVDGSALERHLYLFSQVAELDLPIVVALTMTDLMERQGMAIDVERLKEALGVEVVPVVAHRGRGLAELREAIGRCLRGEASRLSVPRRQARVRAAILSRRLARAGIDVRRSDLERLLLGEDAETFEAGSPELQRAVDRALEETKFGKGLEAQDRFGWAHDVASATVGSSGERLRLTDRIDQVLTHRVFGLGLFLALMYAMFQAIYSFAVPLMEGIEWAVENFGEWLRPVLAAGAPALESLVVDGVIAGVGAMLVFLPQILLLFFFIAILESTGYLARAAFMMDRLLSWCGLNGRAFIPLLSSYACAIPGIMAARVMPDHRSRLVTILMAPFMSCSARLPVYVLLIGAIVEPLYGPAWAGFALFAMHFLGLAFAIPFALVFHRGLRRETRLPFHLELPPYQMPKWRDVGLTLWLRAKVFVKMAGTVIVVMSVAIWALLSFPRSPAADAAYARDYEALSAQEQARVPLEEYVQMRRLADSYLGRFGRLVEPVFRPAGFDWRISTAILCAFPAREVVVPSLGIIFGLGESATEESADLRSALRNATWPDGRPLFTPWTAAGLMAFFALCLQCMGTLAVMRQETGSWRWPATMFVGMTALAYGVAVALHQAGRLFGA